MRRFTSSTLYTSGLKPDASREMIDLPVKKVDKGPKETQDQPREEKGPDCRAAPPVFRLAPLPQFIEPEPCGEGEDKNKEKDELHRVTDSVERRYMVEQPVRGVLPPNESRRERNMSTRKRGRLLSLERKKKRESTNGMSPV